MVGGRTETTLGPTPFIVIEPRRAPNAGAGGEQDRGDFPEKGKAHHLGGVGRETRRSTALSRLPGISDRTADRRRHPPPPLAARAFVDGRLGKAFKGADVPRPEW